MPVQFEQVPGFKGIFRNTSGRFYAFIIYSERHNIAVGPFSSVALAQDAFNYEVARMSNRENENGHWQTSNFVFYKQAAPLHYNQMIENDIENCNQIEDKFTFVSGFEGVVNLNDEYIVLIQIPGKKISIGPFSEFADAAVAHDVEILTLYAEGQINQIAALNFPQADYPVLPGRIALSSPEYMEELRRKFNFIYESEDDENEVIEVSAPPQTAVTSQRHRAQVQTQKLREDPKRFTYATVLNRLGLTSVYSGVRKVPNVNFWDTYFKYDGSEFYLGRSSTEVRAAEIYDAEVHKTYNWLKANRSMSEINAFYTKYNTMFGFKCNFQKLDRPFENLPQSSSSSSSSAFLNQYAAAVTRSPNLTATAESAEPSSMQTHPEDRRNKSKDKASRSLRL